MPNSRPLLAPTGPAPCRRTDPSRSFQDALLREAEAQQGVAVAAYELLAAHARTHAPEAAAIEFEETPASLRIHALWANPRDHRYPTPPLLWRRAPTLACEPSWLRKADRLLPTVLLGTYLPVVGLAGHRRLLNLPAPDVAATLASRIRRAFPHATALLLSLDVRPRAITVQVANIVGPDGTSLHAIPNEHDWAAPPAQMWWRLNKGHVVRAVRHLWAHPDHRTRHFQAQGHDSLMWNQGLQALVLPPSRPSLDPRIPDAPTARRRPSTGPRTAHNRRGKKRAQSRCPDKPIALAIRATEVPAAVQAARSFAASRLYGVVLTSAVGRCYGAVAERGRCGQWSLVDVPLVALGGRVHSWMVWSRPPVTKV
ncbi:hypothetical protein DR950_33875 [Kitasatospora xanthocidica]|uniref:Uncharacterized protein n=1 Tax=Kitasatospora xanthocidica TaxID=83382 RepID=A0A373A3Q2_9ACTN|nr:hypothetical protein [Kitasatospora xanthocidica]RGD62075.1 hypothetical protein DR950_33875 [Kitasatospora xanthocidica]